MNIKIKGGGYREECGIVLADGFYLPYRYIKSHQIKGAKGVSGYVDLTGEGAKLVKDLKSGKYDIKEPYRPFQDEGYIEGKPTERQNELFNKWCRTKNINYYDGKDSLELLFKYAVPRLKKDFDNRKLGLAYYGIDKVKEFHPDESAKWLFDDIWWTLKLFYEPKRLFWKRLMGRI